MMQKLLTLFLFLYLCGLSYASSIIYVNPSSPVVGDGTSWSSPLDTIEAALYRAELLPGPNLICLAQGVYTPAADVYSGFLIKSPVTIIGGYLPTDDWRDPSGNLFSTVISGEIGSPSDPLDNANHAFSAYYAGKVMLHNMTIEDTYTAVLDLVPGGAVSSLNSSLFLDYVLIRNCENRLNGGTVTWFSREQPWALHMKTVILQDNSAFLVGGGIHIDVDERTVDAKPEVHIQDLVIQRCHTTAITTSLLPFNSYGGGIYLNMKRSEGVVINATIVDCDIEETQTLTGLLNPTYGGGIAATVGMEGKLLIQHTTIRRNWARVAGGVFVESFNGGDIHVTSSISYGNLGSVPYKEVWNQGGVFSYNCIEDNPFPMMNNIGGDPQFISDLHNIGVGSVCIDVGNPILPPDMLDINSNGNTVEDIPFDIRGFGRRHDGDGDGVAVPDIGAYERH